MLYSAHIAAGGNAGDHHRSFAYFHVVSIFQLIISVQSQQLLFHTDGHVGTDLLTCVLKMGFIQSYIGCHQFYNIFFCCLRSKGQGGSRENQRQGQAETPGKFGMFHDWVFLLVSWCAA